MQSEKEYNRNYYLKNRDRLLLYKKERYPQVKLHIKEYRKNYYSINRDRLLLYRREHPLINKKNRTEYNKKWKLDNIERYKEYQKQWDKDNANYIKEYYQEHKEEIKERSRNWGIEHKEQRKERSKNYLKTNNGRTAHQRAKVDRQAKMSIVINTLTQQEWLDILEKYNYICVYCGEEFDCENLPTRDHIIPISKGGNNTKENIVPACRSCNSKKHNKILEGD